MGSLASSTILELEQSLSEAVSLEAKADLLADFYVLHRGSYRDYLSDLVSRLKRQAQISKNHYALGIAANIFGWMAIDFDKREEAILLFRESQEQFKQAGNRHKELRALNGEASALKRLGLVDKALDKFLDGIEQARVTKDPVLLGIFGTNLGSFMADFGLFPEAIAYFKELLAVEGRDPSTFASEYFLMGNAYFKQGDYEQAEYYLLQGVEQCSKEGKEYLRALCLLDIACIKYGRNRFQESEKLVQESLEVANRLKIPSLKSSALLQLARIEMEQKNYSTALDYALDALEIRRKTDATTAAIPILLNLATIYEYLEDYPKAYTTMKEARELEKNQFDDNLVNSLKIAKVQQVRRENMIYKDLYIRINTIGRIGQAITSTFAIEEVGQLVYEKLQDLMPVNTLAIAVYNAEQTSLEYRIYIQDNEFLPPFKISILQGDPWLTKNEEEVTFKALQHPEYPAFEPKQSVIHAPLVMRDKVVGRVMVQTRKKEAYHQHHRDILRALAAYIAIAMENGSLFTHVKELASIDVLTGLYNRRFLFEIAEEEFAKSKRYKTPLSVTMIDIDDLKKINDTHGHAAGDRLLQKVAEVFSDTIRKSDMLGCIGGDEFLLISPKTELKQAQVLGERLRKNLSKASFLLEGSLVTIRASFGVAELSPNDTNIEQTINRADRSLYQSKGEGGNLVISTK